MVSLALSLALRCRWVRSQTPVGVGRLTHDEIRDADNVGDDHDGVTISKPTFNKSGITRRKGQTGRPVLYVCSTLANHMNGGWWLDFAPGSLLCRGYLPLNLLWPARRAFDDRRETVYRQEETSLFFPDD